MTTRHTALLLLVALLAALPAWGKGTYLSEAAFLRQAFAGEPPPPRVLWLAGPLKEQVRRVLGHPYGRLRVRYWLRGPRSAWILEEIGKERPITIGFAVEGGRIALARVLVFRESRGDEIRHPAFTRQFHGAGLRGEALDRPIDGITGATLSVRAMRRLARLALVLDRAVRQAPPAP